MDVRCTSIEDVRTRIDHIDQNLVALLAQRGQLVAQAALSKRPPMTFAHPHGSSK